MQSVKSFASVCLIFAILFLGGMAHGYAEGKITSPKEEFGFSIGDDYCLANYTQLLQYWKKVAQESDRMSLVEIGQSAEGRTMVMAILTSPENQTKLERYKDITRRLALAEGLSDEQVLALASEGRAVVWIDGGLHGTEVLGSQQLIELVYQMTSQNDPETLRILDDVILLAACPNPDGMELVADWYMRESDPKKRSTSGLPRLYQKYIGHDNNRDFYMSTQPETTAVNRVFYQEWFPQIVYNHHQTGPSGTVLFVPPFRDPFNYRFDPLVPIGIELVGAAMHNRFAVEEKPGATMRSGARYSTWWNGGLRTTTYFHNMIGILTETIGNPTPIEIPFLPQKQLASSDLPFPIAPQKWHFRQSIEYAITADRAILDLASKHKEDFLSNIYIMGKNSIERGSRDNWTITPKRIALVEEAIKKDKTEMTGTGRMRGYPLKYYDMLHDPALRDPRGYIIPSDQPDFLTAIKFVNALIKTGVDVHRAAEPFKAASKTYAAGSFVIMTEQAFRPHILSMFEPQDHPNDIPCPGGAPVPPYDSVGWTLSDQMGIQYDRILDGFDGPFEKIKGLVSVPAGIVTTTSASAGYLLSHQVNDAFIAINRLLKGGQEIDWLKKPFQVNGKTYQAGTIFIPSGPSTHVTIEEIARETGLNFDGVESAPKGEAFELRLPRIGLWDRYGGSTESGWVRWLLEQFEFPFDVVFPAALDEGRLAEKYDVLIFVDGAVPKEDRKEEGQFQREAQPKPEEIPEEYRSRLGKVTVEKTVPCLRQFLEDGGAILAIGSSTSLGYHTSLPIADALTEILPDGTEKPLPREKFFVPGSLLEVHVDNTHPLAFGMPEQVDVFFDNSPVFRLKPDAFSHGVCPVAWFEGKEPLQSGWAWGQHYLDSGVAVLEAQVGKGKLFLFGPEITFRGQPHGTFKFLFNGIYYGGAATVRLD